MILDDLPIFADSDKSITITPLYAALLLYCIEVARADFSDDDNTAAAFDDLINAIIQA